MFSSYTFDDYQQQARATAIYPPIGGPEIYPALELVNEAGEVAGKIKKIYRDRNGVYDSEDRSALEGELGDCLWALSQLATELGLSLANIAHRNIAKLESRKQRGVLGGSGDDR